jgi:hypothetical protein
MGNDLYLLADGGSTCKRDNASAAVRLPELSRSA